MTDGNRSADDERRTNSDSGTRRRFLTSVGTAAVASLPVVGTAGADSPDTPGVAAVKGTVDSPVTRAQATRARRRAIDHFEDRTGESPGMMVFGDVKTQGPSEDQPQAGVEDGVEGEVEHLVPETVGYAITITDEGRPKEYIGGAVTSQGVPKIHKRVAEKKREFAESRGRGTFLGSRSGPVGGGIGVRSLSDYDPDNDGTEKEAVSPYGMIYQSWVAQVHIHNGDAYWLLDSTYQQDPGRRRYDSRWNNKRMITAQRWYKGEHRIENFHDYEPYGDEDGDEQYSFSLGTGGASLGYTFSQPDVSRYDDTSMADHYTRYRFYPHGGVRDDTYKVGPNVADVITDTHWDEGWEKLSRMDHSGLFEHIHWYGGHDHYKRLHNNDWAMIWWG